MNYQEAGVDIAAGQSFVRAISPLAKATAIPGTRADLGSFGAVFDLKAAGLRDPLLVASSDGVGTKLKIAIESGRHETIGIDLVAMCVNDLVTHGARPLFFLDYYATGQLRQEVGVAIVRGIAEGCKQSGCALVGGETAEMPGLYAEGDYDLAGFAVGAVERERLLPRGVQAGDVLIGLPSQGLHSNGFSLVRKIVKDSEGCEPTWERAFDATRTLADCFLTPTRLYVGDVLRLQERLHAAAHITGGGLVENAPRALPDGLTALIDRSWWVPAEFGWLRRNGRIPPEEMLQTFNCGVGMVLVVGPAEVEAVLRDSDGFIIGEVVVGREPIIKLPDQEWWL